MKRIEDIIRPLSPLEETLKKESRPIFLYGMGNGAEKVFAWLSEKGIKIKGVVASDGFVRGQSFLGFEVLEISKAKKLFGDLCLVLCFGLEGEKSHFLRELSQNHRILSPNLPVFGDGICDKEFILENIEKFQKVFDSLADNISKDIFLSLLKYNVTGELKFLENSFWYEAPEEFFNHDKRHIDIGAYDGDTALEFASKSNDYSDIVAFEPDPNTFKKLLKNTSQIRDLKGENLAVCEKNGRIAFNSGCGRASHCGEGDGEIGCVSIDEYCGFKHIAAEGVPVGSIKIDAEGMDEEVIFGSVNTIYCCKPNLSVALYHRFDDLIKLPLLLKKHNHKYKFYLRRKEYIPAWDIFLYAINENINQKEKDK